MRQAGFSLLEALVTLVLVALITTFLMQGLLQVLSVRQRVVLHESDARIAALQEQWFRQSVSAALVEVSGPDAAFLGLGQRVRVASAMPLLGEGVALVDWRIVETSQGQVLEYRQGGEVQTILGPGLEEARFSFRDASGEWHDRWPVSDTSTELLPRIVRFEAASRHGSWSWWVPVMADAGVPPRLRSFADPLRAGL